MILTRLNALSDKRISCYHLHGDTRCVTTVYLAIALRQYLKSPKMLNPLLLLTFSLADKLLKIRLTFTQIRECFSVYCEFFLAIFHMDRIFYCIYIGATFFRNFYFFVCFAYRQAPPILENTPCHFPLNAENLF